MALSLQIFLLLLVLASFVIAFFSARTWHWGHVLVVLGIFLSTLGFLVLAAETLRIHAVLRTRVNQLEGQLAEVRAQNDALVRGTGDAQIIGQLQSKDPPLQMFEGTESLLSIEELDHRLLLATRIRGRVWRNVAPAGIDAATGAVRIAAEQPVPAGFNADTVVYLFEEGPAELPAADGRPQGKQYLGEFRVVEAAGQQATLLPVLPMDNFERARLAASRGPWAVYETMPVDRHQIFAGMSEEELRKILPRQSVEEYIRHGKEASKDDDEARIAGFDENGNRILPEQLGEAAKRIYQRRLRDYAADFDELARRRIAMEVDIQAVKKDNERLAAAHTSAKQLQAFREDEIKKLSIDLAGITKERQTIDAHLAQVEQQLATAHELLAATLKRNSQLAAELARLQLRSAGSPDDPVSPAVTGPLALGTVN